MALKAAGGERVFSRWPRLRVNYDIIAVQVDQTVIGVEQRFVPPGAQHPIDHHRGQELQLYGTLMTCLDLSPSSSISTVAELGLSTKIGSPKFS